MGACIIIIICVMVLGVYMGGVYRITRRSTLLDKAMWTAIKIRDLFLGSSEGLMISVAVHTGTANIIIIYNN